MATDEREKRMVHQCPTPPSSHHPTTPPPHHPTTPPPHHPTTPPPHHPTAPHPTATPTVDRHQGCRVPAGPRRGGPCGGDPRLRAGSRQAQPGAAGDRRVHDLIGGPRLDRKLALDARAGPVPRRHCPAQRPGLGLGQVDRGAAGAWWVGNCEVAGPLSPPPPPLSPPLSPSLALPPSLSPAFAFAFALQMEISAAMKPIHQRRFINSVLTIVRKSRGESVEMVLNTGDDTSMSMGTGADGIQRSRSRSRSRMQGSPGPSGSVSRRASATSVSRRASATGSVSRSRNRAGSSSITTNSSTLTVEFSEIKSLTYLASGGHADIYLARWNNQPVAVKIVRDGLGETQQAAFSDFLNEKSVLMLMRHHPGRYVPYVGARVRSALASRGEASAVQRSAVQRSAAQRLRTW